ETGAGVPGGVIPVRGGWINQYRRPSNCKIDGFVNGTSLTAEGFVPLWPAPFIGGVGPDVSEVLSTNPDGSYSSATEIGAGLGSGKGLSVSADHVWRIH